MMLSRASRGGPTDAPAVGPPGRRGSPSCWPAALGALVWAGRPGRRRPPRRRPATGRHRVGRRAVGQRRPAHPPGRAGAGAGPVRPDRGRRRQRLRREQGRLRRPLPGDAGRPASVALRRRHRHRRGQRRVVLDLLQPSLLRRGPGPALRRGRQLQRHRRRGAVAGRRDRLPPGPVRHRHPQRPRPHRGPQPGRRHPGHLLVRRHGRDPAGDHGRADDDPAPPPPPTTTAPAPAPEVTLSDDGRTATDGVASPDPVGGRRPRPDG